ncbi:MAG: GIY-YIG nuclease family protein [Bacteroidota bacterium]
MASFFVFCLLYVISVTMYYVYVLYSEKYNKIYIGYTGNLEERLKSHNELGNKGWTIKYRPWVCFYTESFESKEEAMKRERWLKTGVGRRFIWENIFKK